MRILILQNYVDDDAAYLATFLRAKRVAHDVLYVGDGATLPKSLSHYAGLAILGGPNSANDDDAALRHTESLIREARSAGKPVIGHCLGGQLIATALGARVTRNRVPEIGWSNLELDSSDAANEWFGDFAGGSQIAFQWHYETFEIPRGARNLGSSMGCDHQAFAIDTLLAMQFHIEVDADKLERWAKTSAEEVSALASVPTVESGELFLARSGSALKQSQALAARIYTRFLQLARRASEHEAK